MPLYFKGYDYAVGQLMLYMCTHYQCMHDSMTNKPYGTTVFSRILGTGSHRMAAFRLTGRAMQ